MGLSTVWRFVTVTLLLLLALPLRAFADPPLQVIGSAGPVMQGHDGPLTSTVADSERGLSVSLSEIPFLQPDYVPGRVIQKEPGTEEGFISSVTSFGYRLIRTESVVETPADGSYSFVVRVGSGSTLATGIGATAQAAYDAALASPALDAIRASISAVQQGAVTVTQSIAETVTSLLTGFDDYAAEGEVIFGPTVVQAVYVGECATPFSGCATGQDIILGRNDTLVVGRLLRDYYITDTVERVITSVQNYVLTLTLDETLDPPPLTGPEGPVIQSRGGPLSTTLIVSERGLAIPVQEITDLRPQYILNGTTEFIGREGFTSYAPSSGSFTPTPEPGRLGEFVTTSSFAYTATTRRVTVTEERDGGVRLQARMAGTGAAIATTMAATLDEAVEAVLALPQVIAVAFDRYDILANGVSQTSVTSSATVLTGRDTYTSTGLVVFGPDQVPIGNLGRCTVAATTCEGGITLNLSENDSLAMVYVMQDLYLTETVTTVVTSVSEYVMNLILAGADGTPHVGAQEVGLAGAEGFLARMLAEGKTREVANPEITRSTKGNAVTGGGPRAFATFSGAAGSFEGFGLAAESDWRGGNFTGGFAYTVTPDWRLGVALELGQWSWTGGESHAEGDSRKLGVFASYENGPLSLGLSGFVGQESVDTHDAFGASASYDVATRGLAAELGYGFQQGDWTLTPSLGLRLLNWDAPQVTDSAGNVIAAANISQVHPELGLSARRSFVTVQGPLDLQLDARLWTVTGDRTEAGTLGMMTEGPDTGDLGGSLGLTAIWQIADDSALSLRVSRTFSATGPRTEGSIGLLIRF